MTQYVIPALEQVSVPVVGTTARFPVQRIYCVGRNYVDHAQEMGFTGREPPFFFIKPANTVVVANAGETATVPYPTLTKDFQHEIELVALARAAKTSKRQTLKSTFMATRSV
jgi:fumarylpyruvate hydrolase